MSEGKAPPREGEDSVLMKRIDRAMANWPMREKDPLEWDETAEGVLSRIASKEQAKSSSRVSDEDLLRAPLSSSPNEVQSSAAPVLGVRSEAPMTTSTTRERDRSSLQELAKMASLTPMPATATKTAPPTTTAAGTAEPESGKKENSGVIDLAAIAAADPQAPARAKATPLASQGLFDDDAPSAPKLGDAAAAKTAAVTTTSASTSAASAPATAQPVRAVPATPAKTAAIAPAKDGKKKGGVLGYVAIGGVVLAAAAAAGVFFQLHRGPGVSANTAANNPPAVAAPKPTTPPVAKATTPQPPAADTGTVDPSKLPLAGGDTQPGTQGQPPTTFGAPIKPQVPNAGGASPPAPTANGPDPSLVVKNVPTATAAGSPTDLQQLMQKEVGTNGGAAPVAGGGDQPTQPAVAAGSVPLKPPMGAVQGAMGTVLPGARACLGPDDPVSHATITFKSDGSVQSVGVSGGAAGKPAEGCIRGALSKAHVPPFANSTFTWTATIRPN